MSQPTIMGSGWIEVKLNGTKLTSDEMSDILELVVDSNLHLPSMVTILFDDVHLEWVDSNKLDVGKEIEILMGHNRTSIFKGEITGVEPHFGMEGLATLLIRGYDKTHRLHRNRLTRTFLESSDSDIVKKIAGEAGLSADAETTSTVYPYVLQYNQTDMEFLQERAKRIGFQVYTDGAKLYFKSGASNRGTAPALEWQENLLSFTPRLTVVHSSPEAVTVRGWDLKKKEALVGNVTVSKSEPQIGLGKKSKQVASTFGLNKEFAIENLVESKEATTIAQAIMDSESGEFVQAEGVCLPEPQLLAGKQVEIKKVGRRFSGKYLLTSVTHVYREGEWETRFAITGRQPNTISHLLEPNNGHANGHVNGVVVGVVTNIKDEKDDLARVKVKFPWMPQDSGKDIESDWLRLASPMAGAQRGFLFMPEVNDEVLVAFEHGDVNHGYVVGALWNGKDKPPQGHATTIKDGKVIQRVIKTRAGHIITLDDSDDQPKISIVDKTGKNKIVIDSKENSMNIEVDKDLTIKAKGKINIEATQDLTIKGQNMTMEAKANYDMKATSNMTLKATANLNAEATAQLGLKGTAGAKLESSAQTEVSGMAMTKLTSSGMAQIQGSLVKIN